MSAGSGAAAGAAAGSVVPGVGTLVGGAIGGTLGLIGGLASNSANKQIAREANAFSAKQAEKQMQFQRDMSNTAYQRSMADMKKAGLNPMLAYQQGGASTPSGAIGSVTAAKVENAITPAIATALEVRRLAKEIKAVDSQTDLNNATALAQKNQAQLSATNAKVAEKNAKVLDLQMPAIGSRAVVDTRQAEMDNKLLNYDNVTKRVHQGLGMANSAKDLINPLKGINNTVQNPRYGIRNLTGTRP